MTGAACARCRAAIDDLGALDRSTLRAMQDHAAACPDCARRLRDARRVSAYVRGLAPVPPPPDLLPRLLEAPRLAPAPGAPWLRLAPAIAVLALLGALALREHGRERPATSEPRDAVPAAAGVASTAVARRLAIDLVTPPAPTALESVPAASAVVAAAPPARDRVVAAPPAVPTGAASPAPAATEAPPSAPTDRPRRPAPTDEPTPGVCGTIVVRVFTDVAGAGGAPCAGCDGQLTDEDVAIARALALALPPFQLALRAGEGDAETTISESPIEGAGQVYTQSFDIPCGLPGPVAVALGGDLGPWQPCAAGGGLRQVVPGDGTRSVDFALTTACVIPTPVPTATDPAAPGAPGEPLGSEPVAPSPTPGPGPDRP